MRARVMRAFGAQSFGMLLTIVMQIASLPIFLTRWGVDTYGTWLVISAIPAYLSMTDIGMVTVAGNRMMMALGQGDAQQGNRVFQSAQLFMLAACAVVAALGAVILCVAPLPQHVDSGAKWAIAALGGAILMSLLGGLSEQVFRATGRSATAVLFGNLGRLMEWGGSLAGLFLVGSFLAVAVGALCGRIVGVLISSLACRGGGHGLSWGVRGASKAEIRTMLVPALAMMSFPMVNAMSFQGVTLVVAALLGPVSVALFNTYRTVARTAVQATSTLTYAVWPEFSRLHGAKAVEELKRLYERTSVTTALLSIGCSLAIYLLAPELLHFWTHGKIEFKSDYMLLMLAYAAVAGIGHAPRVLMMAINTHGVLAPVTAAFAILLLLAAFVLGSAWGVAGVISAMLLTEIFTAAIAYKLAARAFGSRKLQAADGGTF